MWRAASQLPAYEREANGLVFVEETFLNDHYPAPVMSLGVVRIFLGPLPARNGCFQCMVHGLFTRGGIV